MSLEIHSSHGIDYFRVSIHQLEATKRHDLWWTKSVPVDKWTIDLKPNEWRQNNFDRPAILVLDGDGVWDIAMYYECRVHPSWHAVMFRRFVMQRDFLKQAPRIDSPPRFVELPADCRAVQYPCFHKQGRIAVAIPAPFRGLQPWTPLGPYEQGLRRWLCHGAWFDDEEVVVQHRHWIQFMVWLVRRLPPELIRHIDGWLVSDQCRCLAARSSWSS